MYDSMKNKTDRLYVVENEKMRWLEGADVE